MSSWYGIYLKEMLIFKKRFTKFGYVFSVMITPIIYLLVFGLGLGRWSSNGSYMDFLLIGLVMMSAMTNSYTWVCSSINIGKLMYKSFQIELLSPISSEALCFGYMLSGITKGVIGGFLIFVVGIFFVENINLSLYFLIAFISDLIIFSLLGIIVGVFVKSHEEISMWNNFIITPMAFFSGTFFDISLYPDKIKFFIYIFPLTHINLVARSSEFSKCWISILILILYCVVFMYLSNRVVKNYKE
ncbi:ABC transporter permease [Campylobacter sputorum]|uniref:ABC transporter permease n=1 Tax=Campylobacter sputorum TaxID=206 RepID=UPI00053BFA62|nr:ABC transporter permease [Campylobacter sputorum]